MAKLDSYFGDIDGGFRCAVLHHNQFASCIPNLPTLPICLPAAVGQGRSMGESKRLSLSFGTYWTRSTSMPARNQSDTLHKSAESFRDEFHNLLGRLVHAIARLDFNVGLQLRYWGCEDDPSINSLLKPRTARLDDRLKGLEHLITKACSQVGGEGLQELRAWFSRAHRARAIRNEYAHGRWGVPGRYQEAASGRYCDGTPLLLFIPLDWDMSPDRRDESIEMTLDEFATQVREAELLAGEYLKLTERYAGQAYPGQRLDRAR